VSIAARVGVLAHELNHIWSWGARLATLGVALGRVPGLLRLLAPPRREFDADEGGARLTRYPPGLVSALRKLAEAGQPPDRPGLWFIGLVQPLGAVMPLAEAQAHWVADLITGRVTLPPRAEMRAQIAAYDAALRKRFVASKRHTIEVDFHAYRAELEKERKTRAVSSPAAAAPTP